MRWVAASLGLRVYLHYFDSYSATYGSLGAVIILLTWFYITGLMLLAFLSIACGLILDTVTRGRREMKLLAYLAQAPVEKA